jgi:tRNA U34 5-carboxymethylaminomethyl modifying GTPase MnmE/TrmE
MTQQLVPSRTLAAIATGSGGGVGIVRVSGPLALQIGQKVCAPWPTELASHQLYLGALAKPGVRVCATNTGPTAVHAPTRAH